VATKVVGQRCLHKAEVDTLTEELLKLRSEIAEMELADLDLGDFHPAAVPSEVKSLKLNFRKHARLAARAKEARAQLAEARAGGAADVPALEEAAAQREQDAAKQFDLLEMQKTAPAVRGGPPIWSGPNKAYVSKAARMAAVQEALNMG